MVDWLLLNLLLLTNRAGVGAVGRGGGVGEVARGVWRHQGRGGRGGVIKEECGWGGGAQPRVVLGAAHQGPGPAVLKLQRRRGRGLGGSGINTGRRFRSDMTVWKYVTCKLSRFPPAPFVFWESQDCKDSVWRCGPEMSHELRDVATHCPPLLTLCPVLLQMGQT